MNDPPPSYESVVSDGQQSQFQTTPLPPSISYPPSAQYPPPGTGYPVAAAPGPYLPPTTEYNATSLIVTNHQAQTAHSPALFSQGPTTYMETNVGTNVTTTTPTTATQVPDNEPTSDDGKDEGCYGAIFTLLIVGAIPVTMIYYGVKNIDKCPLERHVPIFLIASGGLTMLMALTLSGTMLVKDTLENILLTLLGFSAFALFGVQVWGSYVVFRKWPLWNTYNMILKDNMIFGCDSTTFLLAFSLLVIFWILIPCFICGSKAK